MTRITLVLTTMNKIQLFLHIYSVIIILNQCAVVVKLVRTFSLFVSAIIGTHKGTNCNALKTGRWSNTICSVRRDISMNGWKGNVFSAV